jgi:hypothetical protein
MKLETHDADKEDLPLPPSLFTAGASLRDASQQTPAKLLEAIEDMEREFGSQQQAVMALLQRVHSSAASAEASKAEKEAREIEVAIVKAQAACAQLKQTLSQVRGPWWGVWLLLLLP